MDAFLIWVIGKDQYTKGLIYYLSKLDNVIVSTTNVEYVNKDVRIISPCDMNELKADAIVLPYSHNISLGKFGRLELNEEFFIKQKDALFFSTNISTYSKQFALKNKLKLYSLFDQEETLNIKKLAILDLIIYAIIETNEMILNHLDIGVVNDFELAYLTIDYLSKLKINVSLSDKIDNLIDQNIIIIPSSIEFDKNQYEKYKDAQITFINLYEDNISFSVIKNGRIKHIYSLRTTSYALLSYAYSFSLDIYKLLLDNQQNE